ncbi:TPA: hypothetical protein DDZ10_02540 [Candidatus Uhrbacteria bacterium]|nr:hypothetical protein [Candidatus Uhrbacteria bacterium]
MEKKVIDLLLVVLRAIGAVVHVELEEYGKRRLLQIGLGGVWELHRPLPGEKGRNTRSRVQLPIPAPHPNAVVWLIPSGMGQDDVRPMKWAEFEKLLPASGSPSPLLEQWEAIRGRIIIPRMKIALPGGKEVVVPNHLRSRLPEGVWEWLRGAGEEILRQLEAANEGEGPFADEATVSLLLPTPRRTDRVQVDSGEATVWKTVAYVNNPHTGAGKPVWGRFAPKGVGKTVHSRRLTLKFRGVDVGAPHPGEVIWAYVGDPAPAWPESPGAIRASRSFWDQFALVEGAVPAYAGTERRSCPWQLQLDLG